MTNSYEKNVFSFPSKVMMEEIERQDTLIKELTRGTEEEFGDVLKGDDSKCF